MLNTDISKKVITMIHFFLLVLCIAFTFLGVAYETTVPAITANVLMPLTVVLMILQIRNNKLLIHREIWLLFAFVLFAFLSCCINALLFQSIRNYKRFAVPMTVLLISATFPYVVKEEYRCKYVIFAFWLAIIASSILSAVGAYVVFSGKPVTIEAFGLSAELEKNLLYIFNNPNICASIAGMTVVLLIVMFFRYRGIAPRAGISALILLNYYVVARTQCRAVRLSLLAVAFMLAVMVGMKLFKKQQKIWRVIFSLLMGMSAVAALWYLHEGLLLFPQVPLAVEDGKQVFSRKIAFTTDHSFMWRVSEWATAFKRFFSEPLSVVLGASPIRVEGYLSTLPHFHNGYLGIIFSYGFIGFGIMAAYLVLFLINAIKLFFQNKDVPAFIRILPAVSVFALMSFLTEENFITREYDLLCTICMFLANGIVFQYVKRIGRENEE